MVLIQVCNMIVFALRLIQDLRFTINMRKKSFCQPMSNEDMNLIAARFRALGEASRLKLVMAVKDGEKNVAKLVAATGLNQANVSRHLKILTDTGIFSRRRHKTNVFYSIADPLFFDLVKKVSSNLPNRRPAPVKLYVVQTG